MELRTALYIYLPLNANKEEIEAAHNIIDGRFGTNPATIISNNAKPAEPGGTVVSAAQSAPTTTTTAPSVTGNASELDAFGLPWDERIHSSNRKKTSSGGWWAKKGTDAAYKAKIEAELRASATASIPGVTTTVAAPAPALAAPGVTTPASITNLPPIPGAVAMPGALPDPAYAELVQLIAQNTQSSANPNGRLTDAWVKQLLEHYQVPEGSLQNLAHAPQLVGPIHDYLVKALAS